MSWIKHFSPPLGYITSITNPTPCHWMEQLFKNQALSLCILTHLIILATNYEEGIHVIPILWMRILRTKEAYQCAHSHTASKW